MFEKFGGWIRKLLLIYVVAIAVESVACLAVVVALSGPADADLTATQSMATSSGLMTVGYSAYVQLAVFILIAVLFLRLLYKAAQQAKSFVTPFTYVSPGWAVGYWFIPLMNLYRPFQVVKALFAACAQEAGPTAKPAAGEQLLSTWWAILLVGNIAGSMLNRSDPDFTTRAGITNYMEYDFGVNLLLIAGALLFGAVVKRLVMALGVVSTAKTVTGGAA